MKADLLVIGAGLAGSCLAAAAARRGWAVALVERRRGPQHKVCGEFLSPEAQGSLRALGLHAAVAALAPAEMTRATLVGRGGISLSMGLPGVAWGVSRLALDSALAEAAVAAGATLIAGATASALSRDGDGYSLELRDAAGERARLTARAAVVACGRRPPPGLRPRAEPPDARPRYVGVKCHYAGLRLDPEVRLHMFAGGYIGLSPVEGGRANVCLLAAEAAFRRAGGTPEAMLDAAIAASAGLAGALAGGERLPESVVAVGGVDTGRPAVLWDGCARLGDAATMIPPLCGDGMAMAISAAAICAPLADEALRGRRTLAEWEAAYSAAWRAEFDRPLRVGRALQATLGLPAVGDALLGLGRLWPGLAQGLLRATRGRAG